MKNNFANLISISRIGGALFVFFLIRYNLFLYAFFVFFIFLLTDLVDGYLARKYSLTSKVGAEIDVIADAVLIYLTWFGIFLAIRISLLYLLALFLVIFFFYISQFVVSGVEARKAVSKFLKFIGAAGYILVGVALFLLSIGVLK